MNRLVLPLLLLGLPAFGQDTKQDDMKECPMHAQHTAQSHQAMVESQGDQAMGFPHDKTTHYFRMLSNGGVIEVRVNNRDDIPNIAAIRSHMKHIARMFSKGDFSTSMLVHDGVPPGTTTMKLMKTAIQCDYEEMPTEGRVWIEANDPIAVAAINDFLRFQITEHQTGDSLAEQQN